MFTFLLLLFSCSNSKTVFWCGDHACINKKEKESYFKKTMTVEKKEINSKDKKNPSLNEELIQQVKRDEKKRIKDKKTLKKKLNFEKKAKIKEQKELAKKLKLEKKNKIKEENRLLKKEKSEEKTNKKEKKKFTKIEQDIASSIFTELKEKIIRKNMFRPYPDLNNIQN